jgi:hypothetical protein
MTKKAEDLSTILRREVREAYLNKMGTDIKFVLRPTFDEVAFRACFATVAHRHGIRYHKGVGWLTQEQQDDRRRYVYYLRQSRRAVMDAVTRLQRNEVKVHPPATPQVVKQNVAQVYSPSPEVAERLKRARAFFAKRAAKIERLL